MEIFLTIFTFLLFGLILFNFWRLHGRKPAYDRDSQIAKSGCLILIVLGLIVVLLLIWL